MKSIYILFSLLILSACNSQGTLRTFGMPHVPTSGPDEYRLGWEDGCRTGMSTYSGAHLKTNYHAAINAEAMKNQYYRKGWEVAQAYCSYYISSYLSNTEMVNNDTRSENTWFTLKGDGFFSYTGFDKMDGGVEEASDIPFFSGNRQSFANQDWTFFN